MEEIDAQHHTKGTAKFGQNKKHLPQQVLFMVRMTGLEPTQYCYH